LLKLLQSTEILPLLASSTPFPKEDERVQHSNMQIHPRREQPTTQW
jgi:hypothetical protein